MGRAALITDDPEPVGYQHWEINYAANKTWRQGSASAAVPGIDINYGVSPDVQLHAQPRYSYERAGGDRHFGIDDTEIGIKYRFFHLRNGDTEFMAGVYPMVQVPTGATSLGPDRGKKQIFLPAWVQGSNDKWTVYGGAGYRINPGTGNRNSVFVGAATLYQISPSLQLGGELFHESSAAVDGNGVAGFNAGGSLHLPTNLNLLFSVGKGLSNAVSGSQRSAYLALQALY